MSTRGSLQTHVQPLIWRESKTGKKKTVFKCLLLCWRWYLWGNVAWFYYYISMQRKGGEIKNMQSYKINYLPDVQLDAFV